MDSSVAAVSAEKVAEGRERWKEPTAAPPVKTQDTGAGARPAAAAKAPVINWD